MRSDQRPANELRDTTIIPHYLMHAEGSVLVSAGNTKVICTASVEDRVPPFLRNSGKGWVTAEYGMLPRATSTRMQREASTGKVWRPDGRDSAADRPIAAPGDRLLASLGERTIWVDCDVIQADGGYAHGVDHRARSWRWRWRSRNCALNATSSRSSCCRTMSATSVGIVDGEPLLDLAYETTQPAAPMDMNIAKTGDGRFIEVQVRRSGSLPAAEAR
jgi:ribonuclease PH